MNLDEIRTEIDRIDTDLRALLLERLECSARIAAAKLDSDEAQVHCPEREAAMADRLVAGVPAELHDEYLAELQGIIRASRMRQYRLQLKHRPELFEEIPGSALAIRNSERVHVLMGIRDEVGTLANALAVIADAGYSIEDLNSVEGGNQFIKFELVIQGDILEPAMRAALLQLYCETQGFRIVGID